MVWLINIFGGGLFLSLDVLTEMYKRFAMIGSTVVRDTGTTSSFIPPNTKPCHLLLSCWTWQPPWCSAPSPLNAQVTSWTQWLQWLWCWAIVAFSFPKYCFCSVSFEEVIERAPFYYKSACTHDFHTLMSEHCFGFDCWCLVFSDVTR